MTLKLATSSKGMIGSSRDSPGPAHSLSFPEGEPFVFQGGPDGLLHGRSA